MTIEVAKEFFNNLFSMSEKCPVFLTENRIKFITDGIKEKDLDDYTWSSLVGYEDKSFKPSEICGIISDKSSLKPSIKLINNDKILNLYVFETPIPFKGKETDYECPIPGYDGWRMEVSDPFLYYREEDFQSKEKQKLPGYASVVLESPTQFNDALVFGEISEKILNKEVEFSFSKKGQETFKWSTNKMPFGTAIAELFSKHPVGEKDGFSFLQGVAIDGKRVKTSISHMEFLVLDLDTGESIETIKRRIAELGYFAIIYTTHSHLKNVTEIKRDEILRYFEISTDPTIQQIKQWLQEVKSYQNDIVEKLKIIKTEHQSGGVKVVVEHNPMQKFRVMFLLDKPFVFAERGTTHKAAMEEWSERYAAVSKKIGAFFDTSCTDPSRLFFTPRHAKGTSYEIHILGGKMLDIEDFDPIPRSQWKTESLIWDKVAADLGDKKQYRTNNVMKFLAKYGDYFEFEDFIREVDPDGDRGRRSNGPGSTWRCPNDGQHSNAGDDADKGFFCFNASESETGQGAFAYCMHSSCFGLDRADYIDLLCQQAGIRDALALKTYVTDSDEEEEEKEEPEKTISLKTKRDISKAIDGITKDSSKEEITNIIHAIAKNSKIGKLEKEDFVKRISASTKISSTAIKAEMKDAVVKKVNEEELDDEIASSLAKYNEHYGVALLGGKSRILRYPSSPGQLPTFLEVDSFKLLHAADKVTMYGADGSIKAIPKTKLWLEWDGRTTYPGGVVFEPNKKINGAYNMWQGFPVKPRVGDWSLLQDHIYKNICKENDEWYHWLITWMAQLIQFPEIKIGSSVVVKGKKGVGKSKVFEWLSYIIGSYAITVSNREHITGKFNAHQKNTLLMVCEEALWGGDSEAGGVLKNLITSDKMMLEQKGFDPIQVGNYIRLAMITNEDWVIPASFDDERRFFVLECSEARKKDFKYFAAIDNQMKSGGAEGFMHYLMEWKPLDEKLGWDILRNPPETEGLIAQKMESLDALSNFLLLVAEEGAFPEVPNQSETLPLNYDKPTYYKCSDIRQNLSYHLRNHKSAIYKINKKDGLKKALNAMMYVPMKLKYIGSRTDRAWNYEFPPLAEIHRKLKSKGIQIEEDFDSE